MIVYATVVTILLVVSVLLNLLLWWARNSLSERLDIHQNLVDSYRKHKEASTDLIATQRTLIALDKHQVRNVIEKIDNGAGLNEARKQLKKIIN